MADCNYERECVCENGYISRNLRTSVTYQAVACWSLLLEEVLPAEVYSGSDTGGADCEVDGGSTGR